MAWSRENGYLIVCCVYGCLSLPVSSLPLPLSFSVSPSLTPSLPPLSLSLSLPLPLSLSPPLYLCYIEMSIYKCFMLKAAAMSCSIAAMRPVVRANLVAALRRLFVPLRLKCTCEGTSLNKCSRPLRCRAALLLCDLSRGQTSQRRRAGFLCRCD